MKAADLSRYAESKGWVFARHGRGSHMIYRHPDYPYRLVIPVHGSRDIRPGVLALLLKQIDGNWEGSHA